MLLSQRRIIQSLVGVACCGVLAAVAWGSQVSQSSIDLVTGSEVRNASDEHRKSKGAILTVEKAEEGLEKDPLKVRITLTNTGPEEFMILWSYPFPSLGIRIYDPQNDFVDVTQHGERVLEGWSSDWKGDHWYMGSGHFHRIPAGESYTWDLDLKQCFSIGESPGEYRVSARVRALSKKQRLGSKQIQSDDYLFSISADK
ncbi:MAG: hypothetical protein KF777_09210 [Planctomycetaceae bacterium]|nr:hypothetical protein [Planctomycetaceae bacterium]